MVVPPKNLDRTMVSYPHKIGFTMVAYFLVVFISKRRAEFHPEHSFKRTRFTIFTSVFPFTTPLSRKYRINKSIDMSSEIPFNNLESPEKALTTALTAFQTDRGCYSRRNVY